MKIKRKRTLATTLVETLPPIGLAGLLVTSLLPALGKAKARANRIKCVSNIKQVGGAFMGFAVDNNDQYPWLLEDRDKIAQSGGRFGAPGNAAWVNEGTLGIVPDVAIDDFSRAKIDATVNELREEKTMVANLLN